MKKNLFRAVTAALLLILVIATAVLNSDKNSLAATGETLSAENAVLVGENERFVSANEAAEKRAATAEARAKSQADRIVARARGKLDKRAAALKARENDADAEAKRLVARSAALEARGRTLDAREAAVAALEEDYSLADPTEDSGGGASCHPSYEGACLDPSQYDYDCEGGSGDGPGYTGYVTVVGPDEYGLDGDGDGEACE
jgi:outer membrane murein-binding lipoprotein Lpp